MILHKLFKVKVHEEIGAEDTKVASEGLMETQIHVRL